MWSSSSPGRKSWRRRVRPRRREKARRRSESGGALSVALAWRAPLPLARSLRPHMREASVSGELRAADEGGNSDFGVCYLSRGHGRYVTGNDISILRSPEVSADSRDYGACDGRERFDVHRVPARDQNEPAR